MPRCWRASGACSWRHFCLLGSFCADVPGMQVPFPSTTMRDLPREYWRHQVSGWPLMRRGVDRFRVAARCVAVDRSEQFFERPRNVWSRGKGRVAGRLGASPSVHAGPVVGAAGLLGGQEAPCCRDGEQARRRVLSRGTNRQRLRGSSSAGHLFVDSQRGHLREGAGHGVAAWPRVLDTVGLLAHF